MTKKAGLDKSRKVGPCVHELSNREVVEKYRLRVGNMEWDE